MARRARAEATKGLSGHGRIPDVGTDNMLTKKAPPGPIGKVAKKGFVVSKVPPSSKKYSK